MPLPKPKEDENRNDFLYRCMNDDKMEEEFPDTDQRYAICLTEWNERDKDE